MVMWGCREGDETVAMRVARCRHCGQPGPQRLSRVRRMFALVGVPLFTVGRAYRLTCARCGAGAVASAAEAVEFQSTAIA